MNVKLKSSVFISAVALGILGVSCVSIQPAHAGTVSKIVSNRKLTTNPASRSITFTGSSALYSKPKISKGARVVASKAVLTDLANSKFSSNNFAAYRQATTKSGSVYIRSLHLTASTVAGSIGGKKPVNQRWDEPVHHFDQGNVPSSLSNYTL